MKEHEEIYSPFVFLRVLSALLSPLDRHADLLQQSLALLLKQIPQVGQRLALRQRLGQAGQKTWKRVERRETAETHGLQTRVPASFFRVLPERLAFACKCQVVVRPQQNQVINDRRLYLQRGEFRRQVLGLGRTTAKEE